MTDKQKTTDGLEAATAARNTDQSQVIVVFEEPGEPGLMIGPYAAVEITDDTIYGDGKTVAAWAYAEDETHGWGVPMPDGEYGLYPRARVGAIGAVS